MGWGGECSVRKRIRAYPYGTSAFRFLPESGVPVLSRAYAWNGNRPFRSAAQVVDAPPGTSDEHITITQCLQVGGLGLGLEVGAAADMVVCV